MKSSKFLQVTGFAAVMLAMHAAQASVVVNVDFMTSVSTYNGLGVIGTGTYWNNGGSKSNLTAEDGITATTIGYAVTGAQGTGGAGASIALFSDYFYDAGDGMIMNITGLDNTKTYNLILYGAQAASLNRGATFTVGAVSKSTTGDQQSTFADGVNYVRYDSISPTLGSIVVQATNGPDGIAIFNGFQLEVIPEPSAGLLLLGTASAGLLRRRRTHGR